MNLIESLETGHVLPFGKPDRVIETLLSKIFFFGNTVCKAYKWKKAFYGDLADPEFRRSFVPEDFLWNNIMSPGIYRKLTPLKLEKGKWVASKVEDAEDFCIVMNKLTDEKTLTDWSESGSLNDDLIKKLSHTIISKQREIADARREQLAEMLLKPLKEIEIENLQDLRDWCYMAESHISRKETNRIVDKLVTILDTDEYAEWSSRVIKSASYDGNGDNVIISDSEEILFIDILPPKVNWRVEDEVTNIGRAASDIATFMSPDKTNLLYGVYEEVSGLKIPELIRTLYEVRGAMIQSPYRYILNQPERAKRYLDFAKKRISEI